MPSLLRTLTAIAALLVSVNGQDCFYPDGSLASGMAACSSSGGACCPYQWECLSNGLCYLENQDYYGRYTCTDDTWQSSNCPQLCTEGNTATGNEALLQCSDGSWCCDGNRSFNCCTTAGTSFFSLPFGSSIAYISSVPSATSVASPVSSNPPASTSVAVPTTPGGSGGGSSSPPSSPSSSSGSSVPGSTTTSQQSASSASSTQQAQSSNSGSGAGVGSNAGSTSGTAATTTSHAVETNSNGAVSTVVSTVVLASSTSTVRKSANSKSSNLGLIIGLAVGIPVFLLACAIIAFILWKRRRRGQSYISPPRNSEDNTGMADKWGNQVGYMAPDGQGAEIDGNPVAMGRTKSDNKGELEGSNGFHHSPAVSTGSAGTAPPGYPGHSPSMQSIEGDRHELWGGYIPYRPGLAELPTVKEASSG